MRRPTLLLLAMAVLVAAGMGLSIFASQVVFEDLAVGQATLELGEMLDITTEISPGNGIYAVEILDHQEGMTVYAHVIGPFGSTMLSSEVDTNIHQELFDVDELHEYTLRIESDQAEPVSVMGVIGPEPDAGKTSLGFVSFYVLVVGVIGMIAATIYMIWARRRSPI